MSEARPSYYAKTGTPVGDLIALLHPPYTMWFLSFAAIGAATAPEVSGLRLAGTLVALGLGLGVGAHALDEYKGRPLGTAFSDWALLGLGWVGLGAALTIAGIGAIVISPWVLVWGAVGTLLAAGYALEWPGWLHSDVGFALTWGPFPVLVGYWAQAERLSLAVVAVAVGAGLVSAAQRALSTPTRRMRRHTGVGSVVFDDGERWGTEDLLRTWEIPLRLLSWAFAVLALGLLASHL